jgi:putative permease
LSVPEHPPRRFEAETAAGGGGGAAGPRPLPPARVGGATATADPGAESGSKPPMRRINDWFRRHLSDPQVFILALLLLAGFVAVLFVGNMLAPLIASIVIAYLLDAPASLLERLGLPRLAAVLMVFVAFLAVFLFLMLGLVPLLVRQVALLFQQMPSMIAQAQEMLLRLPQEYPAFIAEEQVTEFMAGLRSELGALGQRLVSFSVASLVNLIYLGTYTILVPLLVFFFLKDKDPILRWLAGFLPRDMTLAARVWAEVNQQIANYVRGKFYEILIVGGVTYVAFSLLGLQFTVLLAVLTGLSVIIPFVGAILVTVPVALIAYFQFGWGSEFALALATYILIQTLDGNVLAPLLVSGVVNLHPIAVIVAILVFGGIWGFWGVFFAIPLATLVQAVLRAWPRPPPERAPPEAPPQRTQAG